MISELVEKNLNSLYRQYNRPELIHPDPLEFLSEYPDPRDREIVALVASSLAYGRVAQILKSVRKILDRMGPPAGFLKDTPDSRVRKEFSDFQHRFTTGAELATLLIGARNAINKHGSLLSCFKAGLSAEDENVMPALARFVEELGGGAGYGSLLPSPAAGSACKRLHLFLRWMVRRDNVDPGGWEEVGAHRLLVPLDTHMQRICRRLGLSNRKQADLKTVLEVTYSFHQVAPRDPVKYDFALSRLGIRKDSDPELFFHKCRID